MRGRSYDAEIGYLESKSTSDKLSLPLRLRERHLTPETTDAVLQAIGIELQVTIPSERDDMVIRVPLSEWRTSKAMTGTLSGANGGLLSVGRFEEHIDNDGGTVSVIVLAFDDAEVNI